MAAIGQVFCTSVGPHLAGRRLTLLPIPDSQQEKAGAVGGGRLLTEAV
jgi:hypothetical protein